MWGTHIVQGRGGALAAAASAFVATSRAAPQPTAPTAGACPAVPTPPLPPASPAVAPWRPAALTLLAFAVTGATLQTVLANNIPGITGVLANISQQPAAWIDTTANQSAPAPAPTPSRRRLQQLAGVQATSPPAPVNIFSTIYTDSPPTVAINVETAARNGELRRQLRACCDLTLVPNSVVTVEGKPVEQATDDSSSNLAVTIAVPIAVVVGVLGVAGAGYAGYRRRKRKLAEAEAAAAHLGGGMEARYDAPGTGDVRLAANPSFAAAPVSSSQLGSGSAAAGSSFGAPSTAQATGSLAESEPPAPAPGVGANLP
eukprot:scaffold3.g6368.t1